MRYYNYLQLFFVCLWFERESWVSHLIFWEWHCLGRCVFLHFPFDAFVFCWVMTNSYIASVSWWCIILGTALIEPFAVKKFGKRAVLTRILFYPRFVICWSLGRDGGWFFVVLSWLFSFLTDLELHDLGLRGKDLGLVLPTILCPSPSCTWTWPVTLV